MDKTLLVISQVYPPDPAAVGQHIADVAAVMARRGWRVVVYTSARGYDDPTVRYPRRETRDGVDVRRLPLSSFGKSGIAIRLLAQSLFLVQALFHGIWTRRLTTVLVSTSPPFAGFAGCVIRWLRGVPFTWWVMDLNPDQMIMLGKIGPRSLPARVFDWINRRTLLAARDVIVLDRFIGARVLRKASVAGKMRIIPPWAPDELVDPVAHEANPFRDRHGLQGRFVVMYSGNHALTAPLDTLVAAARRLRDDDRLRFVFIGGGQRKPAIDAWIDRERPPHVLSLPYQPFAEIRHSLSAADVHVVSLADEAVGIVHPCKIYGSLAFGRPVIVLSPRESYAADILDRQDVGWLIEHGDVDRLVDLLHRLAGGQAGDLTAMGRTARALAAGPYSRPTFVGAVCDVLEGRSAPPDATGASSPC
ncbi:MAG: glycosyltransferase family 4 protein [Pirellulales bacterium]|jgi:glycosyltransferase involved in cell wall biosynthesis